MNKINHNGKIIPRLFIELSSVTSGNIGSAAIGFLISIILIRRFTTEEWGLFTLALLIFNLGALLADFGLNVSFIRFFSKFSQDDPRKSNEMLISAYITKLFTGLIVFVLLYFLSPFLATVIFHDENLIPLFRWASAGVFGFSIWTFTLASLQAREKFTIYALLKIVYDLVKLIGIAALIYLNFFSLKSVFIIYILLALTGFITGSIFLGTQARLERINYRESLKRITGFSKWILISTFCFMLFTRLDIIMLGNMKTPEEVGYYSSAFRLISVITIIVASLKQVLIPKVSRFTTGEEINNFISKSLKYTLIFSCLIIPFILLSRHIITGVFTEKYIHSIAIFQILSVAFIISLNVEPLFLVAYSMNRPEHLAYNDIFQLLVNFLLNLYLIPEYGAAGAAYATLGSRILMGIFIAFYIRYVVRRGIG